ncbi:MAG: 2,3-bisphosphoglycerate-independent phosphoglycerate mutase [Candidatus Geothermincolia bacterium]
MELLSRLAISGDTKLVLLVLDGLGGLPHPDTGLTELETAATPNLDELARLSACGLTDGVLPGVTPGSGPAHLSLFGYDPIRFDIERGVLSALGIGVPIDADDVAVRINFCTVENGVITDRRAGRISTERNAELCALLRNIELEGARLDIQPEREHRAAVVFKGAGLSAELTDSDPQRVGLPPLAVRPRSSDPSAEAIRSAEIMNSFISQAARILADEHPANMVILRGFSKIPDIGRLPDLYSIHPAAIATYPMYRGLAKLVGMDVLPTGDDLASEMETLRLHWSDYDYFFIHYKPTDSRGEDGDFARKVAAIEAMDERLPELTALSPDVLAITGDHSTPAVLGTHSWHPNPVLLNSRWERVDGVQSFSEASCAAGGLGRFNASELLGLMLASGLRLNKYGA